MKTLIRTVALAVIVAAALAAPASAQSAVIPDAITLNARLLNNGTPFEGALSIQANLFRAPTGGTAVWTESVDASASAGLVAVPLGAQTSLFKALDDGEVFLELTVNGTVLSPRLPLRSVPYALHAVRATEAANAEMLGGLKASELQRRVTGTCLEGWSVRAINDLGQVVCEMDNDLSLIHI